MTKEEIEANIGAAVKLIASHGIDNNAMSDWNYNWRLGYLVNINTNRDYNWANVEGKDDHTIKKFGSGILSAAIIYLELFEEPTSKKDIEALIKKLDL